MVLYVRTVKLNPTPRYSTAVHFSTQQDPTSSTGNLLGKAIHVLPQVTRTRTDTFNAYQYPAPRVLPRKVCLPAGDSSPSWTSSLPCALQDLKPKRKPLLQQRALAAAQQLWPYVMSFGYSLSASCACCGFGLDAESTTAAKDADPAAASWRTTADPAAASRIASLGNKTRTNRNTPITATGISQGRIERLALRVAMPVLGIALFRRTQVSSMPRCLFLQPTNTHYSHVPETQFGKQRFFARARANRKIIASIYIFSTRINKKESFLELERDYEADWENLCLTGKGTGNSQPRPEGWDAQDQAPGRTYHVSSTHNSEPSRRSAASCSAPPWRGHATI